MLKRHFVLHGALYWGSGGYRLSMLLRFGRLAVHIFVLFYLCIYINIMISFSFYAIILIESKYIIQKAIFIEIKYAIYVFLRIIRFIFAIHQSTSVL